MVLLCNMLCEDISLKHDIFITKHTSSEIPAKIHLFKVNNKNTRKRYEICSKLTIKTPEQPQ